MTQDECNIREQGWTDGYERGYLDGHKMGFERGTLAVWDDLYAMLPARYKTVTIP